MLYQCLIVLVLSFTLPVLAGVTTSESDVINKTFDYIIIGGGLTGLTVAGRLTEDPSVTVLVVEAGSDDRENPLVYDIYNYGKAFGTSLDWNWPTDMGRSMPA
jgi:choline dehydrogenase